MTKLKYSGTNQNCIHEGLKSILNTGTPFYNSVQNLLFPSPVQTLVKIKIYRNIILPVVLYGYGTWSLTLR